MTKYSLFDADYTPNERVIALVNQVLDFVEENPDKWDQRNYGNARSTTNCFIGLLIRISGINPEDDGYSIYPGMKLLGMADEHWDRAEYISYWKSYSSLDYRKPTVDALRERVSVALNHDFRKHNTNNIVIDYQ